MKFALILNLLLYIGFTVYYPIYLTKFFKLSFLNPITVSFFFGMPVEMFKTFVGPAFALDEGLFNVYFNYAILMANIDLCIKLIMTIFLLRTFRRRKLGYRVLRYISPKWKISPLRMKRCSVIFLFLFLACFVILASHSFGLINWIMSPRTGYQLHRTGMGTFYALALLFLSTSFTIRLVYTKKISSIFMWTLLYLILVWFMGSKGFLLNFCIYCFIILWFRGYKKINKIIRIVLPGIFGIMLLNFGSIEFEDIVSYFDYYVNSAHYYEEYLNGRLGLFMGEIFTSNIWSLVPRGLYPEKPYVYGFLLVNEYFFPGGAEATNTPAFGGPIAAFADFGVIGVIFFSIFNPNLWFNVFCYYVIFISKSFKQIQRSPILIYVLLITFAPNFMTFIGFPISLFMFLILAKIISISNRVVLKRELREPSLSINT